MSAQDMIHGGGFVQSPGFRSEGFQTPARQQWIGVAGGRFLASDAANLAPRESAVYQVPGGALVLVRSKGCPTGDVLELVVGATVEAIRAQVGAAADAADESALERAAVALSAQEVCA